MRIAYSPSTRLYMQGPLRCVRRFLRWALWGFAGALLAVLLVFGAYPALGQSAHEADSLALVAFYHAAGGEDWRNRTGWLEDPVMDWYGVTLNEDGRVVGIEMSWNNNLSGHLSPQLGRLTELRHLELGDNTHFLRSISEVVRVGKTKESVLAINKLTGPIPSELGNLSKLEDLNLWSNDFTGSIPASLGRLTKLKGLWLGHNKLTGSIPSELRNLVELEYLSLELNGLRDVPPAWLGDLSRLKLLSLGKNRSRGSIPSSLGNLTNLEYLDLGNLHFDPYVFPAWIMGLTGLRYLALWRTNLRGTIPPALFDLQRLDTIFLSYNDLEGALPGNIANAKALKQLYIEENNLDSLGDFSGLPALSAVGVKLNRLTFEDFEDRELPASVRDYDYAPQRRVPTHVARSAFHATFSVEVGGTANKYQWYREGSVNDEAVPGATSDTLVASLSDPPLCYYCKITNAKVPDLTLYSECVSVDDADTQATPDVEASTYTLSLREGGDPGNYMLALRTDPGGTVTVTPISSNEASATVSGALAFEPLNWGIPQTVTVTPVEDANLDDDTVTITHVVAGYACVAPPPVVTVTVADATIIISAEEEEQGIPAAFALEQNYPNPFNPSTTIAFTLNKTQRATLSVYDLLGQKVQTLVDGMRPAARYRIPFDASDLASGTYLYVLRTEEEIAVKTMLLVK